MQSPDPAPIPNDVYVSIPSEQLHTSDEFSHISELETLKKRMQQLVYDQDVCARLIEAARRHQPNKSEVELYRNEIDRIERDRR